MFGGGVRAGNSLPVRKLMVAVLLAAATTFLGVFAVAQAQAAGGAMTGVTLTSGSPGTLTVSWNTPSPAPTDYRLRWVPVESDHLSWKDDNETDRGNAYPAGDATALTLSGLSEGTEFKVQARARNHKGEHKDRPWSGPWIEVQARVMSQPAQVRSGDVSSAPAAPNIVGAAVTPAGQVLLSWLNPSDDSITGYQVLRGPDADSLVVIEQDTGSSGTSYTDTAPPAGRTHTYTVKARNATGLSPLSNTVTATVPAAETDAAEIAAQQQDQNLFLVSNLDTSGGQGEISLELAHQYYRYAQSFIAASNADSSTAVFDFHAITVLIAGGDGAPQQFDTSHPIVTLHSDDNGLPGDLVYTMILPPTITLLDELTRFTFEAPPGSTLSSGDTYWLKIEPTLDSDYFDGDYILLGFTSDDSEVQGPTTKNRWSIANTSLRSQQGVALRVNVRSVQMAVHGAQRPDILVSNFRQVDFTSVSVGPAVAMAQSFLAGPGGLGLRHRFDGIRVSANSSALTPAQVDVDLHADDNGLPGRCLTSLHTPNEFTTALATFVDYAAFAPPGTTLEPGARYWIVFRNNATIAPFSLRVTESKLEDPPLLNGWQIGDRRAIQQAGQPWHSVDFNIRVEILGKAVLLMAHEPAGKDFPGASSNGHETPGVVTVGTVSTGHLTAGLDRNYGLTGDYWYLDTQPGHSYRVEVTFGTSPNNNTGGSVGVEFIDPDHDNYPDASGCCESDHNRDDGHTFVHFYRPSDDWNNRYLLHVSAYDQLNTNSRIYNGPYTIRMTDITGTREFVSNLYQDTKTNLLEVGAARQYAMFFETGYNAAGYKLDRIQTFITHGGSPQFSLYSNTSNAPGTKLCDFRNPSQVQHHVVWSAGPTATTFLATDCAEITLMPTDRNGVLHTYYWIVMEGTNYRPSGMDSNTESVYEPGWRIGDLAVTKTTASWLGVGGSKSIPIGVWLSER